MRGLVLLLLPLLAGLACSSHTRLVVQIQARADASDPVVTYFDSRAGLRFTESRDGLRRRVIFLTPKRMRAVIRRLYPSGRVPERTPDVTAVELHFFNYGTRVLNVDYPGFRIRETVSGRAYRPLDPRTYDTVHYGGGMSGLPYELAFMQQDSFRYHMRAPDWYRTARARRTESDLEYARRREARWRRLESLQSQRTTLRPGRELKGIALFPLLPPDRDYVLEYAPGQTKDAALAFPPFHFRLNRVRDPKKTDDAATRRRVYFAFQDDAKIIHRETRETFVMHEQLREHDRLRTRKLSRKRN